eukprot:TRINITY_DN2299_c0_g2_i1.p1 TRINITY_DN2299_c0_g2~~TRINITY_DN2299_c0_g2_i1.p1  ORF type:complete len:207 (-),score=55.43 TRINITY_DN2299_c0_g2_i1:19-639(-)
MGSPAHQQAIAKVEAVATQYGIPLGGIGGTRSSSYSNYRKGYRFDTTISDQESIYGFYSQLPKPSKDLVILSSSSSSPSSPSSSSLFPGINALHRYVSPTAILHDIPWTPRENGTLVKIWNYGDKASVQWVNKPGTAVPGTVFNHSHPQGQITILLQGKSHVKIGNAEVDLSEGDVVFVPPGLQHTFVDMSTTIELIDILLPYRKP